MDKGCIAQGELCCRGGDSAFRGGSRGTDCCPELQAVFVEQLHGVDFNVRWKELLKLPLRWKSCYKTDLAVKFVGNIRQP